MANTYDPISTPGLLRATEGYPALRRLLGNRQKPPNNWWKKNG